LFNEPFGRFEFDERKYEALIDEIDEMLNATQGEDDDRIDIVIVANQRHLEEAKDHSDHEMLCTSTVVEIDSGDKVGKAFLIFNFFTFILIHFCNKIFIFPLISRNKATIILSKPLL
jgi:hypothetical protein